MNTEHPLEFINTSFQAHFYYMKWFTQGVQLLISTAYYSSQNLNQPRSYSTTMKRKQLQVLVDSVRLQVNYQVKFNIYNTVSQERAGPEKLVSVCNLLYMTCIKTETLENKGFQSSSSLAIVCLCLYG